MAEEGCKLEGLGQDIIHLDRSCSALSVGKIPLHGVSPWISFLPWDPSPGIMLHLSRKPARFNTADEENPASLDKIESKEDRRWVAKNKSNS
ncbi:hypothetical protein GOBAR_AA19468 [Gossypium barbadense]|uniref:Uncharacterized protein n=1 Tax=Gossypium barbadense TaxID=3634 RepID=A0A2P5XCX4_GOSBA|nr:hypothetical protein GOBAR_AA19468 [Gossypium barbadense]